MVSFLSEENFHTIYQRTQPTGTGKEIISHEDTKTRRRTALRTAIRTTKHTKEPDTEESQPRHEKTPERIAQRRGDAENGILSILLIHVDISPVPGSSKKGNMDVQDIQDTTLPSKSSRLA
jgi:hypothetical protein